MITPRFQQLSAARSMYAGEQKVLIVLATVLVMIFGLYAYCISVSITNVLLREEMNLAISEAHTRIGDLESSYLSKMHLYDENHASKLGLVQLVNPTYVTNTGKSRSISFNNRTTNQN